MTLNYEIRVRGRVGDHLADALGLAAEIEPVETVLRGPVIDQEGLHGILDRLQEMGLEPSVPRTVRQPCGRRASTLRAPGSRRPA